MLLFVNGMVGGPIGGICRIGITLLAAVTLMPRADIVTSPAPFASFDWLSWYYWAACRLQAHYLVQMRTPAQAPADFSFDDMFLRNRRGQTF
jgi:hypothetical protein